MIVYHLSFLAIGLNKVNLLIAMAMATRLCNNIYHMFSNWFLVVGKVADKAVVVASVEA